MIDVLLGFGSGVLLTFAAVAAVVHVKMVMEFHENLHRIRQEIERRDGAEDRYAEALSKLTVDRDLALQADNRRGKP